MRCFYCPQDATLHLTEMFSAVDYAERHFCQRCGEQRLQGLTGEVSAWASSEQPRRIDGAPVFLITVVLLNELSEYQILMVQESGGRRTFPMTIGLQEATVLDRRLKRMPFPRPLTHDTWAHTITALGARLQDVCIAELRDQIYFARLRVRPAARDGSAVTGVQPAAGGLTLPPTTPLLEIDVRPSDAIALALVCQVPLFIREEVLRALEAQDWVEQHGIAPR